MAFEESVVRYIFVLDQVPGDNRKIIDMTSPVKDTVHICILASRFSEIIDASI